VNSPPVNPTYSPAPAGYKLALVQGAFLSECSFAVYLCTLAAFLTFSCVHCVVALIRHGDRLPIERCWANDHVWTCNLNIEERSTSENASSVGVPRLHRKHYLNGEETFPGGCMAGQLTKYGYDQHLVNGANLKSTYPSAFPASYSASSAYVRSTDIPRTLQSAQALLRGIAPWSPAANNVTQFVDVYTVDASKEWLYPNPGNCAKLGQYETEAKASAAYQSWVQSVLTPLVQAMSPFYGLPLASMPSPINIFDCLGAHVCHKFPLPGGMPVALYDRMVAAMEWEYNYIYNFPDRAEYGRLAMGKLYYQIWMNFIGALHEPTNTEPQFKLFSAHDTSVMPFLNAIGAWDGKWAPYAALVQMELWTSENGGQPLVRWVYNRQEMTLPGCSSTFCSFNSFAALVQPIILKDMETACQATQALAGQYARWQAPNLGVYTNDGW